MINKKTALIALLAGLSGSVAMAQGTFTNYATGDVLIGFRNSVDMVVDAGPVSVFTNLAANTRYVITNYTGTQLSRVGTNGTYWSAFTYTTNAAGYTLYVTEARSSLNTQTLPWACKNSGQQQATAVRIGEIQPGALSVLNYSPAYYSGNSGTAVVTPNAATGSSFKYFTIPGGDTYNDVVNGAYGGDFNGTFLGDPENYTTSVNNDGVDFTTTATVERSDFYQLTPSAAAATLLGYFEFNTNGVMTYVAYPTATPTINSIVRTGNVSTIDYNTGTYGTYTLRETNNLLGGMATSPTNWPAVSTLSTGDNNSHDYSDTTTDSNRFYIITAH